MNTLNAFGLRINLSEAMTKLVEDWSEVRSPARARRRLKRGFPQRIKHVVVPRTDVLQQGDTLVMHPVTYEALCHHAAARRVSLTALRQPLDRTQC